ncbi:MAG: hypothetical protein HOB92_00180 [Candidatus Cloacimonetes bacterium]|jgi:hypothetical protein|nr:hypothetical protein [Candidatus Cloacimonadota bacterium]
MASKVNVDQEKKNLLSKINRLTDSGELNEESENKIGRVKDELSAKIERIGDDLNVAPSHFCVINKKLGDELQRLLNIIKDINNEFVGYSTLDAIIQIGSDHEYQENQANLYKWAKDFINDRLRKKNPKDKNNELLKYQRLISETDDLEDIRAVNNSINWFFLNVILKYMHWRYFKETWGKTFKIIKNGIKLSFEVDDSATWGTKEEMAEFVKLSKYHEEQYLSYFFSSFANLSLPTGYLSGMNDIGKRDRLAKIIQDVQEMRYFLIKGYKPEKNIIKISNDHSINWTWDAFSSVGTIRLITDKKAEYQYVGVNYDGLFFNKEFPWLTAEYFEDQFKINLLDFNLFIIERVHAMLFSLYEKVDFNAIQLRVQQKLLELQAKKDDAEEESGNLEDDFLSQLCQQMADKGVTDAKQKLRIPRMETFLKVLEEKLGCEVKKDKEGGKGSEITVFRPGGKKAILGRHKKNPRVLTATIKRIQKRLRISDREFVEAFL